jgi:RimJ/RimL family protein N-acetyltransferase
LGGEALGWLHGRLCEHGITTFWATTRPTNRRSIRLLERLGYVLAQSFPHLTGYDPGDSVYCRTAAA